jgi:hypothetical protein
VTDSRLSRPQQSASEALEAHVNGNRMASTFHLVGLDFAQRQAEEIDRLRLLLSEMASKTLKQERHDTLEEVLRRLHDLYNLHRVSGTTDTGRGIALAERSVRELRDGVKP